MDEDIRKYVDDRLKALADSEVAELNACLPDAKVCPVCGESFRPAFEEQVCCNTECADIYAIGMNIWNSVSAQQEFMTLWKRLFELAGEDPNRPGLVESPRRILGMWQEVFEGMQYSNDEIAQMNDKCFDDAGEVDGFDGMVILRDITCFSTCEHHAALIYNMHIHIGYIPQAKVIGLSKMARIADMVCKRFQLQERIGHDIRHILEKILGTPDIIVVIEAEHGCMTARGIKKPGASTVTASLGGVFSTEAETRSEFYSALKLN